MGFIALSMFLLVLSGTAFAIKDLGNLTLLCIDSQTQCCINGAQNCCDDNGSIYDTSCFGLSTLCTAGQKKYTASGCSYTTETCCDRGEWCSGTCKTCSSTSESRNCSGNVTNATGGTQTRSRSVTSRCGSCSYGSWGSWTGTCTCASGYTWQSGACISQGCTLTCTSSYQFLDKANCRCCRKTCLWGGMCDCTAGSYLLATTCCDIRISGTVRSIQVCCGYQSCNEMATALGGSVTGSPYVCSKDL